MINILKDKSIKEFTTFGVPVTSKFFAEITSVEDLKEILNQEEIKNEKLLILGGGSNMLFTKNYEGLVVKNSIKGISIEKEEEDFILIKSGAGENWHDFVLYCVKNNYSGIENLSLIPGSVGASPIQNIGAYGVEVKDVFHSLEAFELKTGKIKTFNKEECGFEYRESIFKNELKYQFVIVSVTFKLNKSAEFNVSYGAIKKELKSMKVEELSLEAISNAIINIRKRKLPDPKEIGNAGSFFKNPVIGYDQFELLKKRFPSMAHYMLSNGSVKVAAGWLIEHLGFKGKRIEDFGVHENQALVLVNYGESKGKDIFYLSKDIMEAVSEKFGITIEREVSIY